MERRPLIIQIILNQPKMFFVTFVTVVKFFARFHCHLQNHLVMRGDRKTKCPILTVILIKLIKFEKLVSSQAQVSLRICLMLNRYVQNRKVKPKGKLGLGN